MWGLSRFGMKKRMQTEVDFVCNKENDRLYIQSALRFETREKTLQEFRPYSRIGDTFPKLIVGEGQTKPWRTKEGILDFLLD